MCLTPSFFVYAVNILRCLASIFLLCSLQIFSKKLHHFAVSYTLCLLHARFCFNKSERCSFWLIQLFTNQDCVHFRSFSLRKHHVLIKSRKGKLKRNETTSQKRQVVDCIFFFEIAANK